MAKIADQQYITSKLKKRRFKRFGTILIEEREHKEMMDNFCPGCGKTKLDPIMYFGEEFCGPCVAELDPNKIYEKRIKGVKGFKMALTRK